MNIAIISQGPSATLWTGESYDVVIGVNSIPTMHVCDWWVFVDYNAFSKQQFDGSRWCDGIIGKPKIATRPGNRERLAREQADVVPLMEGFTWNILPVKAVPSLPSGGAHWQRKGGLAALGLAWGLRPQRVDCWGVDMEGVLDAKGCDCGASSRSPMRWELERFTWSAMVARMNGEGIAVRRALAGGGFADFSPENTTAITGVTRWQYDNGHGFTTTSFPAAGEHDFRLRLNRMIGRDKARGVKVRQVA